MLLLRKGAYPYEYMDSWERFNEIKLPDKKSFYSELKKEDITDEDYKYAHKVWKSFNIKKLRRISWPIYSSRYITTCRHIWEF